MWTGIHPRQYIIYRNSAFVNSGNSAGCSPDFWGDVFSLCRLGSGKRTWRALRTADWDPRWPLVASTTWAGEEWNNFDDEEAGERLLPSAGVGACGRVCGRLEGITAVVGGEWTAGGVVEHSLLLAQFGTLASAFGGGRRTCWNGGVRTAGLVSGGIAGGPVPRTGEGHRPERPKRAYGPAGVPERGERSLLLCLTLNREQALASWLPQMSE